MSGKFSILFLCFLTAGWPATEHPKLRMKAAAAVAPAATSVRRRAQKRLERSRVHLVVQFQAPPTRSQLQQLQQRGLRVLRPIPDDGYLVSAPAMIRLAGQGTARFFVMRPAEKISPLLLQPGNGPRSFEFLVEFHPDVTAGEQRRIAVREGLTIHDNPDLDPEQLLVEGTRQTLRALAEWDEVAYLFPASRQLQQGIPVIPCAGAVTSEGRVGQYVATVGDGWDGPGRGTAQLSYSFQRLTEKLPADLVKSEIERALQEWSRYIEVKFRGGGEPWFQRNVNFLFATGYHGDPYPFDGPGRVLAHTFYPAPPNPEPIAGDVHYDDDEDWRAGADVDLYSITLHELGHMLGLGHSDNPADVMYPYYHIVNGLAPGDVAAIRTLYATTDPQQDQPDPLQLSIDGPKAPVSVTAETARLWGAVSGGGGTVHVKWRNNRGVSGNASGEPNWVIEAVPLRLGENIITVTATSGEQASVSRAITIQRVEPSPPRLVIISPPAGGTYHTSEPLLLITGVASDDTGINRVTWTASGGASGEATGATQWTAGPIPLIESLNTITITAVAGNGGTAAQSLTVRYEPPSPPDNPDDPQPPSDPPNSPPPPDPPVEPQPPENPDPPAAPDHTAPSLNIIEPPGNNVLTTRETISLRGTAADNVAVVRVAWSTNTGHQGVADGLSYWRSKPIPLLVGLNIITVRAFDAAGNSSWRSLMVTRR